MDAIEGFATEEAAVRRAEPIVIEPIVIEPIVIKVDPKLEELSPYTLCAGRKSFHSDPTACLIRLRKHQKTGTRFERNRQRIWVFGVNEPRSCLENSAKQADAAKLGEEMEALTDYLGRVQLASAGKPAG